MNDDLDRDRRQPCGRVRPLLHETMDRELTSRERGEVDAHLASCVDCAEFAEGLETVRTTLASLPAAPFPDDALQEVFARTIDAEPRWRAWLPSTGWRVALTGAAALALAGAALWTGWNGAALRPDPGSEVAVGDPTVAASSVANEEQLRRALEETRYALALAAGAVRRSGRAAVEDVLQGAVAPALHRIPVRFPASGDGPRRDGV